MEAKGSMGVDRWYRAVEMVKRWSRLGDDRLARVRLRGCWRWMFGGCWEFGCGSENGEGGAARSLDEGFTRKKES
ncbi:hypothetical protein V6N11_049760 [Hibiscus sabdariffa]|uniref:Uncharacterized protein n=1 Tax=Hibiscus sabdariffa TaxID=183260 RepID=A0ABR2T7V6_9ROSI